MNDPGELIAFIDESHKPIRDRATGRVPKNPGSVYALVAVIVLVGDLSSHRSQLESIEVGLGATLHYGDLSRRQRQAALEAIAAMDFDGYVFFVTSEANGLRQNEHRIRARLLEELILELDSQGIKNIVLESRGAPDTEFAALDNKDHQVVQKLRRRQQLSADVMIRHDTKNEKMLILSDLIAGALTDDRCAVESKPLAYVAHRIRDFRSSPVV